MMAMDRSGLTKLTEECGELIQIAAKKSAFMDKCNHPDGKGQLNIRLEHEISDVMASINFVTESLQLNVDRINNRAARKLKRFKRWNER
jgi:NTP pyrophosphatase (non-canonical NTP hydrolase)